MHEFEDYTSILIDATNETDTCTFLQEKKNSMFHSEDLTHAQSTGPCRHGSSALATSVVVQNFDELLKSNFEYQFTQGGSRAEFCSVRHLLKWPSSAKKKRNFNVSKSLSKGLHYQVLLYRRALLHEDLGGICQTPIL